MAKLQSGTRVYGNTSIDTFITVGANASITGTTNATSNSTGTLTVAGGVGIKGNVFTGSIYITGTSNNLTFVDGTTLSTSPTASISAAFTQANTATIIGQAAYTRANSEIIGTAAYVQANTATTIGQAAFVQANTANTVAIASYVQANTATIIGQAAYGQANTATTIGQAAFVQANTANTVAIASYVRANAANLTAVTAFDKANTVNAFAQAAFDKANTGGSGSSSGYLANSIIFANTTGYLSNVNGLQFFSSNNTIRTTSLTLTTGAGGQITFADGTTQSTRPPRFLEIIAVPSTSAQSATANVFGVVEIPVSGTINLIRARTTTGTCNVIFKINSLNIGYVNANANGAANTVSTTINAYDALTVDVASPTGNGLVVIVRVQE